MPKQTFIEAEAMLLAVACDGESSGPAFDALIDYLNENFLPGELRALSWSAAVLSDACRSSRGAKEGT